MTKVQIQKEIVKMLPDSGISRHQKIMTATLLHTFGMDQLKEIWTTLKSEKKKLSDLDQREKRAHLKHQVAMDKLTSSLEKEA